MSLKKTSKRGHGTMTELNITPLLDLVFVLLVIFIITTPQLMNNLEINLPSGKPQVQKPKVEPTRIEVSGQGQISLDNVSVTAAELKAKLTALKAADPELGVVEIFTHGWVGIQHEPLFTARQVLHDVLTDAIETDEADE